jgi:hypothetical protein
VKIELRFERMGDPSVIPPWWYWRLLTEADVYEFPGATEGWDFTEDDAFQQAMDAKESLTDWYWKTNQLEL